MMTSRKTDATPPRRLSRRGFLKGLAGTGLAGSASLATGMFPSTAEGAGAGGSAPAPSGREASGSDGPFATLIDISACVGCGACVQACRDRNAARHPEPTKPFPPMFPASVKAEDWSARRDTDDRLTPYNWLYIQSVTEQHDGRRTDLNIPRRCLHCDNPPCANLCPWGAARREDSGTVSIDADICLGGAKCRTVCPWQIPQRQTGVGLYLDLLPRYAGNGVMYKCDRCADVVARGGVPACIEACPNAVQSIGPRDTIIAEARRLAMERGWHLYGLDENGGTSTIYLSPVPFAAIQAALEAATTTAKPGSGQDGKQDGGQNAGQGPTQNAATLGSGRPHFRAVADAMRNETMLAAALVTAPLAGAGAALLRVARGIGDMIREDACTDARNIAHCTGAPDAPDAPDASDTADSAARRLSTAVNCPTCPTRTRDAATDTPDPASPSHPLPAARWLWIACATVLGVTGMAQMPIAARYGIAAVPGLGWTADFYFTHLLHYAAAAVLLALAAWLAVRAFAGPRIRRLFAAQRLTGGGTLRLWLAAALVVTGGMRVAKNLPGFDWGPTLTMYLDWTHLGLAGLLGLASLALALTGRSAWTVPIGRRTPPASAPGTGPSSARHHEHPPRA
ncbi:4Fe-4S dicluster domain-containing protein [Nitratidesulfovibrio sp. HK-II]|uniref:4Fe-4S dicluster domain-containing protein n=1 Tax=Nitratidesulfovibrio sp. HK-II TaxID=2009266 RepID=UPI000E2F7A8F|nr:iron-sulfur cluster-binding protein [Nitratidesulfovibrio sp. HK-II]